MPSLERREIFRFASVRPESASGFLSKHGELSPKKLLFAFGFFWKLHFCSRAARAKVPAFAHDEL